MLSRSVDGNLDEALGYALRARQALPEVDDVADTLGWIYLKKHLPEPAIAAFGEALELHKEGDFREVRLHLAAALDLKPDLSRDMRELRNTFTSRLHSGTRSPDQRAVALDSELSACCLFRLQVRLPRAQDHFTRLHRPEPSVDLGLLAFRSL